MRVVPFTETNWVALPLGDAVWPDDLPPGTSDLNRYRNVLPNPSTRVQLAAADASDGTDARAGYINANYVRGARLAPNEPSRPRCYIATMGPLQHTVGHFWRMVWQENTTVIFMVTGLIEGGKSKCERYWPEEGGTLDVCGFRVSSVETAKHAGVTLTKLELFHGGQSRIVHHFWHEHWPDHTQPKNPRSSAGVVLQMLACARRLGPTSSAPWVVHCSAGVGRSGERPLVSFVSLHSPAPRRHRQPLQATRLHYQYYSRCVCCALLAQACSNCTHAINSHNTFLQKYNRHSDCHRLRDRLADISSIM